MPSDAAVSPDLAASSSPRQGSEFAEQFVHRLEILGPDVAAGVIDSLSAGARPSGAIPWRVAAPLLSNLLSGDPTA